MEKHDWKHGNMGWGDLTHHVYLIGRTGAGKTTLMRNAIVQLQQASRQGVYPCSVWYVDPKGDDSFKLIQELNTLDRVVLLDPVRGFSVNPFELPPHGPREKDQIRSLYIGYVLEIIKEWYATDVEKAPRMLRIMEDLLRYLYHESDAPTWIDLHDLVVTLQSGERSEVETLLDHMAQTLGKHHALELKHALESIARMRREAFDSVLTRITKFAVDPFLRKLFSVRRSTVEFSGLLEPDHVVIVRVAGQEVGLHLQPLITSVVVLKLWFSILERARRVPEHQRVPVILFIDEFQNLYKLGVLNTLLAQARSFKLGLWLVHQNLTQIDDCLLKSILGNTGIQVAGRISGTDASRIARNWEPQYAQQLVQTLTTIPDYDFLVRERPQPGEEQAPPYRVEARPPPQPLRPWSSVEEFAEKCRLQYGLGTVEGSIFDKTHEHAQPDVEDRVHPRPV